MEERERQRRQEAVVRDLQRLLHVQLVGAAMDAADATDDTTALQALQKAAAGQTALLILDDVWQPQHFGTLSGFLDTTTPSRTVVTTRVQGLVPGAVEVPLGLLPPDEAASLLLSVAGMPTAPPHSKDHGQTMGPRHSPG